MLELEERVLMLRALYDVECLKDASRTGMYNTRYDDHKSMRHP